MVKNLKLNIKNAQIAEAINLSGLKNKLENKKASTIAPQQQTKSAAVKTESQDLKISKTESPAAASKEIKEEAPRIKARSRSAFAEPSAIEARSRSTEEAQFQMAGESGEPSSHFTVQDQESAISASAPSARKKTSEELRREIFADEIEEQQQKEHSLGGQKNVLLSSESAPITSKLDQPISSAEDKVIGTSEKKGAADLSISKSKTVVSKEPYYTPQKLGPTGKHIKDLMPQPHPIKQEREKIQPSEPPGAIPQKVLEQEEDLLRNKTKAKGKTRDLEETATSEEIKKGAKSKFKEFRDIKPIKRQEHARFDARDRQGLRDTEEDQHWRKKRAKQIRQSQEDMTLRPTSLKVRIPISIKDLAVEMKLKASQLIAKLFSQGVIVTLNDLLEDETTIQLLGHEFGCEIQIDTSEERRIRITDLSTKEEIIHTDPALLKIRPPVVTFMGHVDHGKTSLIDAIRKSNRIANEAGAITQHIGAFRCSTPVGDIAILDTPGHEAFSAMRVRGADVTDIVVLVIAGDEGIRQQTIEAMQHAKAARVTIVVALNKCDKPNFNAENVYRQLAEHELLPEVWGGQIITVNCSAVTGEGILHLLEMLALQAEVLELRASPSCRARGMVLESEMHKGKGAIATVLVQNGTLRIGDALVFGQHWGKVKTMHDEYNRELNEATPSTPVEITGLSGLPEAGQEFIVVKSEREAREIADARMLGVRQTHFLQAKKISMENLFQQASETSKKILNIVLRADVQGSLEALKAALIKIESKKADLNIIFAGVGEISESDAQLAAASKAVIIGFHTQIEGHAEALLKQLGIQCRLHNIIYHAIDDVKDLLSGLLDKIAQETEKGKAEIKALFKSSQYGIIAGCIVTEGSIHRNHHIRLRRNKEVIWNGTIVSLKRVKDDVREVAKGLECGIVLNNCPDIQEGDSLESYEITYISQEL